MSTPRTTSATDATLHQRRRPLTPAELDAIPWLNLLAPADRERAVDDLRIAEAEPGEYMCRMGRPVTYWFGVIDGLLKMSSDNAEGQTMTFTGVPPGGWFGEGTALKRETYRYNIQALRKSLVAGLHVDTFHWLLDHSIAFNRFVMNQLNERLGQFIAAREIDRMTNPDIRVARSDHRCDEGSFGVPDESDFGAFDVCCRFEEAMCAFCIICEVLGCPCRLITI